MEKAIRTFAEQFLYDPVIENGPLPKTKNYIAAGMGGSHLAAGLLKIWNPALSLIIHRDYGLPPLPAGELENSTLIASSYSGNTEETVYAFEEGIKKKMPSLAITTGGKLLEIARNENLPHIKLPQTGIQPRSALGFSIRTLLLALGLEEGLLLSGELASTLKPEEYEAEGKNLAQALHGKIPVIYSSARNEPIAYNWKIKFNETGKIPSFYNVFPELNHNEMTGFDTREKTRSLSEKFHFIFLKDSLDYPRVVKRMEILEKLLESRGFPVTISGLEGENPFQKMFSSLLLADWASFYTAKNYDVEPEKVPMVEEFKKLIAE